MWTPRRLAAVAAIATIAAGCGGADDDATGELVDISGPADTSVAGEVVILSDLTGQQEVAGFDATIRSFEEQYPDITVDVVGLGSGEDAHIFLYPQPGLLSEFYEDGALQLLQPPEDLGDRLVGGLLELGTIDGDLAALPLQLSLKSLVWYNVPAFEAGGYEVPATWSQMMDLTEEIAAAGDVEAPWCIGISAEAQDATGWPATDWVEDILLRAVGPEQYDAWVAGDLAFNSDQVRGAIEDHMVPIWTNDDYVLGGREAIAHEPFATSVNGILTGEGGDCMFHRQASFIESFIADNDPGAEFGTDYDFFLLPEIEEGELPALGGGSYAALSIDTPAAIEFMKFLTTAEAGEPWAAMGGFLSPFTTFDGTVYPSDSGRRAGDLLAEATAFRFDGSDQMPPAIGANPGAGSFWDEMTAWIAGEKSLEDALAAIDEKFAEAQGTG